MKSWLQLLFIVSSVLLIGCFKREVIAQPGTPVLIDSAKGSAVVYAYDKQNNKMIKLGTIDLSDYSGWTLANFDWADKISKEKK